MKCTCRTIHRGCIDEHEDFNNCPLHDPNHDPELDDTVLADENTTLDYLIDMRSLGRQVRTTLDEPQFDGCDQADIEQLLTDAVNMIHDMKRSAR